MVGIRIFREMKRLVKSVEMKTGLWKSLKCLTLLFDGDTYKNSLSSLRVCFNNSLNTTKQYYSHITLRIHRTFRIQLGIRNDTCSYSNTSSLQQNILTPTITKVIFTTVILTEQMYFLACRYTCA